MNGKPETSRTKEKVAGNYGNVGRGSQLLSIPQIDQRIAALRECIAHLSSSDLGESNGQVGALIIQFRKQIVSLQRRRETP